jgi:hypothetical protein
MDSWQRIWRNGLVPLLSRRGLEALRQALVRDVSRLVQHATCNPPPSEVFRDEAVEGACAVGFCAWQGDGLETVGEIEAFFVRTCQAADEAVGEPAACRFFLNWFDETPRDTMRRQLLPEINRALNQRHAMAA